MKKFLSVLLMVAGLMSCGDDDKPFIPELNKLTSVTCTKNGNAFFNANITYDQDKQILRIKLNDTDISALSLDFLSPVQEMLHDQAVFFRLAIQHKSSVYI